MHVSPRRRRFAAAAVLAVCALVLAACAQEYPNTTFAPKSEFGRAIDELWDQLLLWGTIVFILVQVGLIYILIRFRRREGQPRPRQIHGNAALEITWTLIPAVILVLIAVPTVRAIFRTQAPADPNALQIEVIGHQWWWEFRYPQYDVVTANELYLPVGRTVNFSLQTRDVLHSFWIPQLGGKRDLITNRTNYLWFTPDDTGSTGVWNGFCAEYCGTSHANMRFRAFTVTPDEFERWLALQRSPAAFGAQAAAPAASPAGGGAAAGAQPPGAGQPAAAAQAGGQQAAAPAQGQQPAGAPAQDAPPAGAQPQAAGLQLAANEGGYYFPHDQLPGHAVPSTPLPRGFEFDENLQGDPQRGMEVYSRSLCIACHVIRGNPRSIGRQGPDLTHIGSRTTLGAGMYPNDTRHLVRWIKDAMRMKPGSLMPPQGQGLRDPRTGVAGTLTDQQIADIAAYLQALK